MAVVKVRMRGRVRRRRRRVVGRVRRCIVVCGEGDGDGYWWVGWYWGESIAECVVGEEVVEEGSMVGVGDEEEGDAIAADGDRIARW